MVRRWRILFEGLSGFGRLRGEEELTSFDTLPLRVDQDAYNSEEETRTERLAVHEALEAGIGADFVVVGDDDEHPGGYQPKDDIPNYSLGVMLLRRPLLASCVDVMTEKWLMSVVVNCGYSTQRHQTVPFRSICSSIIIEPVSLLSNSLQHVTLRGIRMHSLKISKDLGMMQQRRERGYAGRILVDATRVLALQPPDIDEHDGGKHQKCLEDPGDVWVDP